MATDDSDSREGLGTLVTLVALVVAGVVFVIHSATIRYPMEDRIAEQWNASCGGEEECLKNISFISRDCLEDVPFTRPETEQGQREQIEMHVSCVQWRMKHFGTPVTSPPESIEFDYVFGN